MVTNLQQNSTEVTFKATYPIDFHLYNHNEENVLFLDNNPIESLRVVVQNCSENVIQFDQSSDPTASPENYHFTLTFRPGTLLPTDLKKISLTQGNGWDVSAAQDSTNKTICWYFLNKNGFTLNPNETVALSIQNFKADGGSGSRTTRVLLEYGKLKNVHYSSGNSLAGSRKRHLSIINHRGQKNIPLHVGFVGSNTILNDGTTPNSLTLHLTNLLQLASRSTIPLNVEAAAPSKFIISFDAQSRTRVSSSGVSPVLSLGLDRIDDGQIPVFPAGSGISAKVCGTPNLVFANTFAGKVLNFDGTSDYVDLDQPAALTSNLGSNSFTFEAWIKIPADNKSRRQIISLGQNIENQGAWFYVGTDNKLHFDLSGVYGPVSATDVGDGKWHHVAVVNNADKIQLYVDGEAGTPQTMNPRLKLGKAIIGMTMVSTGWYFVGQMANVRIYNRALVAPEIRSDMQQGQAYWGLATLSQVKNIEIAITDGEEWTTEQNTQGEAPEWVFTNNGCHAIRANESIGFNITNVISSLSDGSTNLYFRYENIPGYWDGQFVVPIHKGPMVFRGQKVGIGTTKPQMNLVVHGNGKENSGLIIEGAATYGFAIDNLTANPDASNVDCLKFRSIAKGTTTTETDDILVLQQTGNVGIGTTTPTEKLTISGNTRINNGNLTVDDNALVSGNVGIGTLSPNGLQVSVKVSEGLRHIDNVRLGIDGTPRIIFEHSSTIWELDNCRGVFRIFNPAVQFMIAPSGNVGIGTTNPRTKLVVNGNGTENSGLVVEGAATFGFAIDNITAAVDYLKFRSIEKGTTSTKTDDILVLQQTGNVGIGTTTPTEKLTINGNTRINNGNLTVDQDVNIGVPLESGGVPGLLTVVKSFGGVGGGRDVITAQGTKVGDTNYNFFAGYHGGTLMCRVQADGIVYATAVSAKQPYYVSSDKRLKKDIKQISNPSEKIKNINGVSFTGVDNTDKKVQLGLIAQELEKEFPELVITDEDGYRKVNYDGMIPVLLEAIKEQDQRFSAALKQKDQQFAEFSAALKQKDQQIAELTAQIRKIHETLDSLL